MGWSTEFFTNISFSRETFNNLSEVEDKLKEINDSIRIYEGELRSLALITEPKKFCDEEQDPLWYIQNKVSESLEELDDLYVERFKLSLLVGMWKYCHDEEGFAIAPPENFDWNTSFLDGDFIEHKEEE